MQQILSIKYGRKLLGQPPGIGRTNAEAQERPDITEYRILQNTHLNQTEFYNSSDGVRYSAG